MYELYIYYRACIPIIERRMTVKKIILINIITVIVVVVVVFFGGLYYYNNFYNKVITDDAKVTTNLVTIYAPTSGKIVEWDISDGTKVKQGDLLGKIQFVSGDKQTTTDVVASQDGTIIKSQGTKNNMVVAGTPLGMLGDLSSQYVIANVKETDLNNIKVGQTVKIYVDAYPSDEFEGKVEQIGLGTADVFSLFPSSNSSGNYTKVTERVPVKISISTGVDKLIPGLNVTVKIEE